MASWIRWKGTHNQWKWGREEVSKKTILLSRKGRKRDRENCMRELDRN